MDGGALMGIPSVMALSGGMDSTCLMLHLLREGHEVTAFGFEYGQRHRLELDRAKVNVDRLVSRGFPVSLHIVDLRSAMASLTSALTDHSMDMPMGHYEENDMRLTVVPNRNAVFSALLYAKALSLAGEQQGRAQVALGVHSGDHAIYPDCRPEFYEALEHAFALGNWDAEGVNFVLPYLAFDKATILSDGLASCDVLELDFDEVMASTLTSYQPDEFGRSAGTTGSDVERILAFHDIGRKDPVEYTKPWGDVLEHALFLRRQHQEGQT
jgi:7-cyano-7-deazaguanine synthase